MNTEESQRRFEEIISNLTSLRKKKNQAYGNGFMVQYEKYGEQALFFDLLRKWQRIENLLFKGALNEVEDETVQDTLGDLAVMCVNGMIWLEKRQLDIEAGEQIGR